MRSGTKPTDLPPMTCLIKPQVQTDWPKLKTAISKLSNGGSIFSFAIHENTHAIQIEGVSEKHLETIQKALTSQGVSITIEPPEIICRATVARTAIADFTHKKQFGHAGQFARVILRIQPNEIGSGLEFANDTTEETIPEQFVVGVENGLMTVLNADTLVRYQNFDLKVSLLDGAYHPQDSSVLAFEIAARAALREGFEEAGRVVLEPMMKLEVTSNADLVGIIKNDLRARGGNVIDTSIQNSLITTTAIAPLANLLGYDLKLKAFSSGHASVSMTFSHYQALPGSDPFGPENFPPAIGMRA